MAYTPPAVPYFGPVAHSSGNGNLPINRIVIHYTAGNDATGAQGTAKYFQDPAAGGSAHYITDSDETIQCAYDNVVCWHAPPNQHSLGIEMECSGANDAKGHWTLPSHVAMMHRTAKLVAQKCIQYGVPIVKLSVPDLVVGKHGICGHVDVSNAFHQSTHTDPGPYFPWPLFMTWVHEEAALIGGAGGPIPIPPEVFDMQLDDVVIAAVPAKGATPAVPAVTVRHILATQHWFHQQFSAAGQFNTQLDRIEKNTAPKA
jgi:hypothetical protein